jgi:RNA polymerase sigma-70 factor (ECF subfamily)
MRIVSTAWPASPLRFGAEDHGGVERALVERARAGDSKAFRLIFERHAPAVRRFLHDLLRDGEAADECTQETFVRAHGRLSSLRDEDKILPWLLGIARHVFHEALRAKRPRLLLAEDEVSVPTPEAVLMGREADRLLTAALACLDEERRAALLLRIDHGLDYDEIRAVMGWSLAKVKNEIHRGRLELRERLQRYVGGRE